MKLAESFLIKPIPNIDVTIRTTSCKGVVISVETEKKKNMYR